MPPLQALQMLDNIIAQVSLNRTDHGNVQQAVASLRSVIDELDQIHAEKMASNTNTPPVEPGGGGEQ